MKARLKNEKGITLATLVVTIIVVLILAGVGIGTMAGARGSINNSGNAITMSDLTKIQQVVMETYITYKQTENESVLKGIEITYAVAQIQLENVDSNASLRVTDNYDGVAGTSPEQLYYKLQKEHLQEMGLENVGDDEYIVNYSTGEVFDITNTTTATGEKLYIYAK